MAATTNHPSFMQPSDPTATLWRYMDLSKFAALLQRRALAFARADQLGDPFEGSLPQPNANLKADVMAVRKSAPDEDPFKGLSDEAVESIFEAKSTARRTMLTMVFVNCWHINNNESAAMWKVYAKSSDAICVRTNYNALVSVLPDDVCTGVIRYIDYGSDMIENRNLLSPFLVKRRSFAYEQEARAVLLEPLHELQSQNMPMVREIPIDINRLIERVYVSPASPPWFREVIVTLSQSYGLTATIRQSEIDSVPLF